MPRRKREDGKRNIIGLKVSDATFARIEVLRGDVPRAVWLGERLEAVIAAEAAERPVPTGASVGTDEGAAAPPVGTGAVG